MADRRVTQRGGSLLNDVLQDRISGEVGWQQKSYPLGGDGTHALVWVYSKDSGGMLHRLLRSIPMQTGTQGGP